MYHYCQSILIDQTILFYDKLQTNVVIEIQLP